MSSISVNPPKTPVTTGSSGIAAATVPNVCKMPGPPAPFVPTPLPNIAKSGNSPKDFSKNVTFDGCKVAIKGATFTSIGDIASKATGGGIVSANVEGPARPGLALRRKRLFRPCRTVRGPLDLPSDGPPRPARMREYSSIFGSGRKGTSKWAGSEERKPSRPVGPVRSF
ncbi:PAAR-like domain-containing protein [Nannocystis pusilla]|uniref:PAAR-like domain-containing protein n=1 Tax=Nannocystis pusilla TaxID=889268 RepID=UPI003BF06B28